MKQVTEVQLYSIAKKIEKLLESNVFRENTLDAQSLFPHIADSAQALIHSFEQIKDPSHFFDGDLFATLSHGDVLANFLLRLSNSLGAGGNSKAGEEVASLNKVLHGLDFFPTDKGIPEVLMLVHPVSTVVGRATLADRLVLYQNVTVGGVYNDKGKVEYPRFLGPAILNSGVSVLGKSEIYENVVFGANSFILNCTVPPNSVVVGQYPNHRILTGNPSLFDNFFRH